jgi:hypothetical protein
MDQLKLAGLIGRGRDSWQEDGFTHLKGRQTTLRIDLLLLAGLRISKDDRAESRTETKFSRYCSTVWFDMALEM